MGRAVYPPGFVPLAFGMAAYRALGGNLPVLPWVAPYAVAAWAEAGAGDWVDCLWAAKDRLGRVHDYAGTRWCVFHRRNLGHHLNAKAGAGKAGGAELAENPGRVAVAHPPGAWSPAKCDCHLAVCNPA